MRIFKENPIYQSGYLKYRSIRLLGGKTYTISTWLLKNAMDKKKIIWIAHNKGLLCMIRQEKNMLGNIKGKLRNEYVKDYILFDLETTGMFSPSNEVIEISAVKVRNGKVVAEFSELVNPGRSIPFEATQVNNITDAMVANAPRFEEVLARFVDFIGDDILVGHNIHSFDMKFMYRDCEKYFGKTISNDYIDTLKIAKICFPSWKHRRLSDLSDYYGISTEGAHRALADCRMNQKVFECLGKELTGKGTVKTNPHAKVCPLCKQPLKKRSGRYGEFWGCLGFPDCRYTENM